MASSTAQWYPIAEPVGDNAQSTSTDKNVGGMVVSVTNGDMKEEVSRVAWVRRNAKNARTNFADQLKAEMEKAQQACEELNKLDQDRLQAAKEALAPIRETLVQELTAAREARSSIDTLTASDLSTAVRVADALKHFDSIAAERVEKAIPDLKERIGAEVASAQQTLDDYDKAVQDKLADFATDKGTLL